MEYLTVNQVADMLNLHPQTVREKIKDGQIKSFKPGKSHRIPAEAVHDYIRGNENKEGWNAAKKT